MKMLLKFAVLILLLGVLIHLSCKKEYSCEGCRETNKPPVANAGADTIIVLPVDSSKLDGSASADPDGTIRSFLWTKISGPVSYSVKSASSKKTVVGSLTAGTYQFELKVTDNGGLSAKDTMNVTVDSLVTTNHPPIANAGPDQTISLPINTITLDGSGSADHDNNITSYGWTKISGPSSCNIADANTIRTQVTSLLEGIYLLELKVTDVGGLFSKDTLQVTVNPLPASSCNPGNRPWVNAQLIPIGTLSGEARSDICIASAGNKILFAGGNNFTENPGYIFSTVDIYDIATDSWSTASLSEARFAMGVAVLGNKIFFAGGATNLSGNPTVAWPGTATSRIDIYDASNNTWSTTELSEPRYSSKGESAGNKAVFSGGVKSEYDESARVDVFDTSTNTWTTAELSQERRVAAATAIGNKIFFAGGKNLDRADTYGSLSRIDIYNASSNTWSIAELNQPRDYMAGIAVNNKNYWAGGDTLYWNNTNSVELREANESNSVFECLFQPNAQFDAVLRSNKIVFFTGQGNIKDRFDIYDVKTDTWSIGVLPVTITEASIISVNNIIYVAGGFVNGVYSNQVWKLEF